MGRSARVLLAVVAGLLLTEGGLRVAYRLMGRVWFLEYTSYDPVLGFRLRPGYRSSTPRIAINSLGYRNTEFTLQKPKDHQRWIFIGDSCVFGVRASEDARALPQQVRSLLERDSNAPIHVINAGVPSYTSSQVVRFFHREVLSLDPDVVFSYVGWNNLREYRRLQRYDRQPSGLIRLARWLSTHSATYLFLGQCLVKLSEAVDAPRGGRGEASPADRQAQERMLEQYRRDVEALLIAARQAGVRMVLLTLPSSLRAEEAVRLSLYYHATTQWPAQRYRTLAMLQRHLNTVLRELGASYDAQVIDLEQYMDAQPFPQVLRWFADPIHPSDDGYAVLAQRIVEAYE